MLDTSKIQHRRPLRFNSLDEMLADARTLAAAPNLKQLGNWTLGQALNHLAAWIDYPYLGYPPDLVIPEEMKANARAIKHKLMHEPMRPGEKLTDTPAGTFGTEVVPTDVGLAAIESAADRLRSGGGDPPIPDPAFGPVTAHEWTLMTLRHAELHLSFFVPRSHRFKLSTPTYSSPVTTAPQCSRCGYSLAGLGAGSCPECGCPFDPSKLDTIIRHSRLARLAPPFALNIAFAVLVIPVTLVICSPRGELSDWWNGMLFLFVGTVALCWGAPLVLHLAARARLALRGALQPSWRWSWLAIPTLVCICYAFQSSGLLFRARWSLSRQAFDEYMANPTNPPPKRLGAFLVVRVFTEADGSTRFDVGFPDLYSQGCPEIIYQPAGFPMPSICTTNLGGGWWVSTNPT